MGEHVIKMPDIGEGVAEAELVEWEVAVGDEVREDQVLAAVMTDKATVEIPAPRDGKILWLGPEIGEVVAVGSPIMRMEIEGEGNATPGETSEVIEAAPADADEREKSGATPSAPESPEEDAREHEGVAPAPAPATSSAAKPAAAKTPAATQTARPAVKPSTAATPQRAVPRPVGEKPLASPAVRKRALDAGIDLRRVPGSGEAGQISHDDLDAFIESGGEAVVRGGSSRMPNMAIDEIKVVGLRRKIAEKMQIAKTRIPHITYVDEVDVTALEELRAKLNREKRDDQPKLTLLPFLMRAMARAIAEKPQMNARYDDDAGVIHQHGGMHMGVAAQTDKGLVVPVVRHVEALSVWDCASELMRLAEAAKDGSATRDELTGATITITSLGAMGGLVTTPVINYPEVAIVGVNKMRVTPVWQDTQFVPRKMMNLSSSFDHRVIDGWDAAVFIQRIKGLLESPAMIFIED
jgi:2-oxoisovalerate dehydrogenase E2 component (dihydrolipoyl transacylase)|tara:strand:+ start:42583 stop:43980 length:1398 start_codon:yes stop_codon:yes gene_type:complete